jgi:AraC family transcriptional regulator, transcriptional activator of pobA
MENLLRVESISQIHEIGGLEKPRHPLISFIESTQGKALAPTMPLMGYRIVSGLYIISLKNGHECRIVYGRQNYDFQEGSLIFLAPGQTIIPAGPGDGGGDFGWVLCVHPDLIRKSSLAGKMQEYTFFSYDAHEALHLSEAERATITNIGRAIRDEYSKNLDGYSQDLILSNLELLLNHSKRFYGRQFITRTSASKDVVTRFEAYLRATFASGALESRGLPSVKECAREMGYSPNYLSDLLRKETGKNTQEHLHFHLIEKAKDLLLGTDEPVSRIAYALGFEYPQHFSKLFKSKTGSSPAKFRH